MKVFVVTEFVYSFDIRPKAPRVFADHQDAVDYVSARREQIELLYPTDITYDCWKGYSYKYEADMEIQIHEEEVK